MIRLSLQNITGALFEKLSRNIIIGLSLLISIFIAVRYAEPVFDGDLFWHLAYARQMLNNGTLIVSALPYSWTPTSNQMHYCAWISELTLYGLWNIFGLAGIFALRYMAVIFVLFLVYRLAVRQNLSTTPIFFFIIVMLTELIYAGTPPKAELFSLVYFTSIIFIYTNFRSSNTLSTSNPLQLYAVPAIILLWVNSHGAFILISPFLAATAIGELALVAISARARLANRAVRHLILAWAFCGVAVVINPYGLAYPVELFNEYALGSVARPDGRWNMAMRSIFAPNIGHALVVWLFAMVTLIGILAILTWKKKGAASLSWAPLGLAALPYIPLYIAYLRSTHFLPIIVACLALGLSGLIAEKQDKNTSPLAPLLVSGFTAALALLLIFETCLYPAEFGWLGFGISTLNPVSEAEFLARQKNLGPDIYNVFDSGGYLLWRLNPQYLVMTDSRSFPYLSWFDDQYNFTKGTLFQPFLAKYPADVAVIDLAKQAMWQNFVKSNDWRLVYYGATAAIFVDQKKLANVNHVPADTNPQRFYGFKSVDSALNVFEFATYIGDYSTANLALHHLTTTLRLRAPTAALNADLDYRNAIREIAAAQYPLALTHLQTGLINRDASNRDALVLTLLVSLVQKSHYLTPQARAQVIAALNLIVPHGF